MDVQRKKGILEICVLAVLKRGPSYGYMIIREMEQCIEISESTLYPILKRLEQNGSLTTYRREYNGRQRKYYQLTQEGQEKIDRFLGEWEELRQMYRFIEEKNQERPISKEAPEGTGEQSSALEEASEGTGAQSSVLEGAPEGAGEQNSVSKEALEGTGEEELVSEVAWEEKYDGQSASEETPAQRTGTPEMIIVEGDTEL